MPSDTLPPLPDSCYGPDSTPLGETRMNAPSLIDTSPDHWTREAMCAQTDPELYHPEQINDRGYARRLCRNCPVIEACLQHALDNNEMWGVWGGKTAKERRKLAKKVAA